MSSTAGKKIFLAGLFHETHSFVDDTTPLSAFDILRGQEILERSGDSSPLGGFLEFSALNQWAVIPGADYRAIPSGTVEDEVFEAFRSDIEQRWNPDTDAIFLVLHGAMVTSSIPDVEGEILGFIRTLPGAYKLPLFGVFDLHANFSPAMAKYSDCLVAYRQNPHTDAREAAIRSAELLRRCLTTEKVPCTFLQHSGLIWTPERTATATDPMETLEVAARTLEENDSSVWAVNIVAGFSYADTPDTGLSFQVIGTGNYSQILEEWNTLAIELDREAPGLAIVSPAEALQRAKDCPEGLTVLVEPSDNIGGGAPGDCTGLLRALIENDISNAAVCINDPSTVDELKRCVPGEMVTVSIGGMGSRLDAGPIEMEVELISCGGGRFELEDKQSHLASVSGSHFDMGQCAVVRHRGITILLTSNKTPPFDLGQWRSQGIEPCEFSVVAVKAAVAHRRVYDPIASQMIWVDTPGPCPLRIDRIPYRNRL